LKEESPIRKYEIEEEESEIVQSNILSKMSKMNIITSNISLNINNEISKKNEGT